MKAQTKTGSGTLMLIHNGKQVEANQGPNDKWLNTICGVCVLSIKKGECYSTC